jgi:hypothetical protein
MPSFWHLISTELHIIFGLLDDVGDISSALVITIATLKVAVAFARQRARRARAPCALNHPQQRRRRRRRSPCVVHHATTLPAQRQPNAHTPNRRPAA